MTIAKYLIAFPLFLLISYLKTSSALEILDKTQETTVNKNVTDHMSLKNVTLNVSKVTYHSNSFSMFTRGKRWQLGRVSRKHFDVLNMLWRKPYIFDEMDYQTPKYSTRISPKQKTLNYRSSAFATISTRSDKFASPIFQTSTLSSIEFYYLDEHLDTNAASSRKNYRDQNAQLESFDDFKQFMSRSPLFALRINNPTYKRITSNAKDNSRKGHEKIQTNNLTDVINSSVNNPMKINASPLLLEMWPDLFRNSNFLQNFFINGRVAGFNIDPSIYKGYSIARNTTPSSSSNTDPGKNTNIHISITTNENVTKANDKIKFFEIYDSHTFGIIDDQNNEEESDTVISDNKFKDPVLVVEPITVASDTVVSDNKFKDPVLNVEPITVKPVSYYSQADTKEGNIENRNIIKNVTTNNFHDKFSRGGGAYKQNASKPSEHTRREISKRPLSKPVPWANYSFAAVFVYERFQVHCDAAAISPHWLVASASCLSRHRDDPNGEDRSAFVTYCGENWWSPERIAYVKYTVIHPRFNPKDIFRRHQYNIGVIQVVSSMPSSCPKWIPITIMSHQYLAEDKGSPGTAVGWGLDRYDTSYASNDLPRRPLSLYESLLYSNNCPGNTGYSTIKQHNKEVMANVYCLSLPPYSGEDIDPVHGGLLLVGGKLIALYLQEERRRWGEQCAQYTGIWRQVPWILEVTNEPEDFDYFI